MNNQNNAEVKIIDSTIKSISKEKHSLIKRNEIDSVFYYALKKESKEILSISSRNKVNGDLISFYFSNGELIKVVYQPKKVNNNRTGGLYYFINGDLIYKEEYELTEVKVLKFLELSKYLKQKFISVDN